MDSQNSYFEQWDSWQLLSIPLLDTSFDADQRKKVEQILRARGITGMRRVKLELVVFGGLWWNFIWGEWLALGLKDIVYGWSLNAGAVSGLAVGTRLYELLMQFTLLDKTLSLFAAIPIGFVVFLIVAKRMKRILLKRYVG